MSISATRSDLRVRAVRVDEEPLAVGLMDGRTIVAHGRVVVN